MSKAKIFITVLTVITSLLVLSSYIFTFTKFISPAIAKLEMKSVSVRLLAAEDLYQRSGGNNVLSRRYVNDFFKAGRLSLAAGDWDTAIKFYTFGLTIDCWRADKIFELGLAYEKKAMYPQAYERFNQALSLNPEPLVYYKAKLHLWLVKNKIKNFAFPAERVILAPGKLKSKSIYLLAFGVDDPEMLDDLRLLLQEAYKLRFIFLGKLEDPVEGFASGRNQYFVMPLLKDVRSRYEGTFSSADTQAILIVTSHDITDEGLNFLFGRSSPQASLGIISYRRFLLDNPDRKTLFMRIYTQALSTAGFLLGLPRCSSSGCARSYPHSLEEFKRKSYALCNECKHNLDIVLEKMKEIPEVDTDLADLARLEQVKFKYGIK